jgi:dipeptidyl aminopeptidase/acylaminoacyl peptidase
LLTKPLLVESEKVQVFSTTDPGRTLEAALDPKLGRYLTLGPWAPDSSAFVLYSAEEGYSHCPFSQAIVVRVDEQAGTLTLVPFDPHCTAPSPFASASWSPDGSRLAITLNRKQIYLVDQQARLQRTISPWFGEKDEISGLWWTESGLLVHVETGGEGSQRHELWRVDPDAPDQQYTLFESPTSLSIVGIQSGTGHVLVREQDTGYPPAETFNLSVLDPESGSIEHTLTVKGSQCVADTTPHPQSTPLKITQPGGSCTLWLYDWQRNELHSRGPVTALVGWRDSAEGFLVVRGTPPDDIRFEVVE